MSRKSSLLRRLFAPAIVQGRAFSRDERGVTAIEFAILGLPFFTIILAILETAMVFLAGQVLDSAVEDASRLIRTGQAQVADYGVPEFRSLVCDYTFGMFDCSKIAIKVVKITNFASSTTTNDVWACDEEDDTCDWTVEETFEGGVGRDVIQVFAYYRWPLVVTLPYFNLKNQTDNYRLLAATRVFRNEPF